MRDTPRGGNGKLTGSTSVVLPSNLFSSVLSPKCPHDPASLGYHVALPAEGVAGGNPLPTVAGLRQSPSLPPKALTRLP